MLVVFHDDMLDRLLEAYGDVGDYTWEELRRFRFRDPGRFGDQCRIPTLVEVFDLHRKYGGLMHLDIKRPGLDGAIADLLTRMDLWDHVALLQHGQRRRDPARPAAQAAPLQGARPVRGPQRGLPRRHRRGAEEARRRRDRR